MTFRPELIEELFKGYHQPEDLMGEGEIFKQLSKALIERCLSAEIETHLEEERSESSTEVHRNRRNSHSKKTAKEGV
jgi:putative transposase